MRVAFVQHFPLIGHGFWNKTLESVFKFYLRDLGDGGNGGDVHLCDSLRVAEEAI
jgi:hypothetical protein